jgi:hypothetical protein
MVKSLKWKTEMTTLGEFIKRGHARRAGAVENLHIISQRQKLYKNFALVARFNKLLSKDLLSGSLRQLMLHYPVLATSVVKADYPDLNIPRPLHDYIKVMDNVYVDDMFIDIPSEIKECENKGEQLSLLNDITWTYGDETPLWKLGFLDDYTLVYLSNHVLSDGTSAKFFVSKLQQLLNTGVTPCDVLVDYDQDWEIMPHLPPPVESIVDYTPPWSFTAGFFLTSNIIKRFCFTGVAADRNNEHSYRLIRLDSSKLQKLLTNLRANGVTMTPYIVNCALNAMYQTVLNQSWLKLMDVVVPCDSRQYLPQSYNRDSLSFGSMIGIAQFWFLPVKAQSWGSISYVNKIFQYCRDSRAYLYGASKFINDSVKEKINLDKARVNSTIGVPRSGLNYSNIGVIPQEEGEYEIEDVIFSKNAQGCMNSFSMSSCSTKYGMNIVITMTRGTTTEKEFDLIATILETNILSLI